MWLTYRASLVLLAIALVGCASEKISVRPRLDSGAAIGEGLDAPFFVVVVSCGGIGDCIEDGSVSELEAKVDDEGVAELLDVSEGSAGAGFTLRGASAGETSVELATAIDDASFEVQVAEVAASRLLPLEENGLVPSLDLRLQAAAVSATGDAYRVLAGSELGVGQMHFEAFVAPSDPPPSERLYGFASLQLETGATAATLDTAASAPLLRVGAELGTATVSTAVGGAMSLEVVDEAAVDRLSLVDAFVGTEHEALELARLQELFLVPRTTDGGWILGAGDAPPTVSSSDPTIVRVSSAGAGLLRRFRLAPVANGSAQLTCAWLGKEWVVEVAVSGL